MIRIRLIVTGLFLILTPMLIEFFTVNIKLPEIAILASMDLNAAKKVTSSEAQPDDHWIKRLLLVEEFNV